MALRYPLHYKVQGMVFTSLQRRHASSMARLKCTAPVHVFSLRNFYFVCKQTKPPQTEWSLCSIFFQSFNFELFHSWPFRIIQGRNLCIIYCIRFVDLLYHHLIMLNLIFLRKFLKFESTGGSIFDWQCVRRKNHDQSLSWSTYGFCQELKSIM